MKPDLYTKAVLTVIAALLLMLCAENIVLPRVALAQQGPQKVMLVGPDNVPLKITSGNLGVDLGVFLAAIGGAMPIQPRYDAQRGQRDTAIPVFVVNK